MKNNLIFLLIIIKISLLFCFSNVPRLTNRELAKMEKNKQKVGLIYVDLKNITHRFFMEEFSKFLMFKPLEKYNFGYLDIENDQQLLKFFSIKNKKDSGIIFYNFANKNYYVGESINHIEEVKDICEQIKSGKLNWSSNSIIEKIFFLVTGKRYGKDAHTMFSFGLCLISIMVYMGVNYKLRRDERDIIEKRLKTK